MILLIYHTTPKTKLIITRQQYSSTIWYTVYLYMHAIDTYIHSFITPCDSVYNSYNAYFMQDEGF